MPTRPLLVHIRDKPVLMADLGSERHKRKGAVIGCTQFLRSFDITEGQNPVEYTLKGGWGHS
jgi:hypothetical protein